jgi:hypothetical protein
MGTAAALAVKYSCSPREVGQHHLAELQAGLMDDDCFLPGFTRPIPNVSARASLSASAGLAEPLRNGIDRVLNGIENGWWGAPGESVTYAFDRPVQLSQARLVFDSDQSDKKRMPCWYPKEGTTVKMPAMLAREFALEIQAAGGDWQRVFTTADNSQRLLKIAFAHEARAVRFIPLAGWGQGRVHLMAFDLK